MSNLSSRANQFWWQPRRLLIAAVLLLTCNLALTQATSSDYTNDLPSVERVKAEIKGSDETDSLARQAAVFTYMQVYIYRIMYNRNVRGTYTPGEQRAVTAYSQAAYQISQDYAKTHKPAETRRLNACTGSTRWTASSTKTGRSG